TWSSVDVETGGLQRVRDGDCPGPGPVALVGGDVVWDCPGAFDARSGAVGPPVVFVDGAATMLAFSDGTVWRVPGRPTPRAPTGSTPAASSLRSASAASPSSASSAGNVHQPVTRRLLLPLVFISGMTSLAVELGASRLLAPYFGTSLYVWGILIGLILFYLSI